MVKPYQSTPRALLREARRRGKLKGEGAADTQYMPGGGRDTEGNAAERAWKALRAYDAGDVPTVSAMTPPDWLSGEWADEPTPRDVFEACGGDPDRDPDGETAQEVCDEFVRAADAAYVEYMLAHLRSVAAPFIAAEKARVRRALKGKG
jgi:hypothetical protein